MNSEAFADSPRHVRLCAEALISRLKEIDIDGEESDERGDLEEMIAILHSGENGLETLKENSEHTRLYLKSLIGEHLERLYDEAMSEPIDGDRRYDLLENYYIGKALLEEFTEEPQTIKVVTETGQTFEVKTIDPDDIPKEAWEPFSFDK